MLPAPAVLKSQSPKGSQNLTLSLYGAEAQPRPSPCRLQLLIHPDLRSRDDAEAIGLGYNPRRSCIPLALLASVAAARFVPTGPQLLGGGCASPRAGARCRDQAVALRNPAQSRRAILPPSAEHRSRCRVPARRRGARSGTLGHGRPLRGCSAVLTSRTWPPSAMRAAFLCDLGLGFMPWKQAAAHSAVPACR